MRSNQYIIGIILLVVITGLSFFLLKGNKKDDSKPPVSVNSDTEFAEDSPVFATDPSRRQDDALSKIPLILPVPEKLSFAGEEVPLDDPDVRERFEKELYITAHRYYQVMFYMKRGPRILPYLAEELRKADMPEDFIYLSVIESDLIPTIRSPKGALGLWQFMPATGRRFGLKVNRYIDERMHVEKSTEAAIQFLKNAKEKTGSWTLASAAYNMGLARTLRTMESQKTDNYYKMYLNPETARYVFKILAAKVIIENPKRYGYSIPDDEVYRREPFKKVEVNGGITSMAEWADKRGFNYYDIKKLNPWIKGQRLPEGEFTVKLPK